MRQFSAKRQQYRNNINTRTISKSSPQLFVHLSKHKPFIFLDKSFGNFVSLTTRAKQFILFPFVHQHFYTIEFSAHFHKKLFYTFRLQTFKSLKEEQFQQRVHSITPWHCFQQYLHSFSLQFDLSNRKLSWISDNTFIFGLGNQN